MGWRVKVGALALFLVAVAAVTAVVVLGLGSGSSPAGSSPTEVHRRLAVAQAASMLGGLRLPAGARSATTSGGGVQTQTLQRIGTPSAPDVVTSVRTWTVPAPGGRVAAFLLAHPVPGFHASRPSAARILFTANRLRAGLSAERITLALGHDRGPGTTTVVASAQATWIVARPASEVVPAGARVVDIVRGKPGHRPGIALKVTDPQLSAIRRLIDALPTAQPGVTSCPQRIVGLPQVSFIFRTHEGGPVLAVASEDADVTEPTTACDPLGFSIGGRARTPLLDGARLLRQVSRIVHHRLWLPPYAA